MSRSAPCQLQRQWRLIPIAHLDRSATSTRHETECAQRLVWPDFTRLGFSYFRCHRFAPSSEGRLHPSPCGYAGHALHGRLVGHRLVVCSFRSEGRAFAQPILCGGFYARFCSLRALRSFSGVFEILSMTTTWPKALHRTASCVGSLALEFFPFTSQLVAVG